MPALADAFYEDFNNPLDGAEDILAVPGVTLNRANRDELFVEAVGRYGIYKMMFMWDEVMGALQFACEYEMQVPDHHKALASETVLNINSGLWLGHFDLPSESLVPTFRYTQLFRGMQSSGAEHVHDLINIAIDECDRNYPVFLSLCQRDRPDAQDLNLAMMPVAGRS